MQTYTSKYAAKRAGKHAVVRNCDDVAKVTVRSVGVQKYYPHICTENAVDAARLTEDGVSNGSV